MQHAGGVGRVAEHDEIGIGRHEGGVQVEGPLEHDLGHPMVGLEQRSVRFGELRVHHDRAAPGS
jgi:hypothetical protein